MGAGVRIVAAFVVLVFASSTARADALADRESKMIERVKKRDWAGAMRHARAALRLARDKLGDDHPQIAKYETNIGDLAVRLNKPRMAAYHFKEALDVRVKTLGENHGNVALTLWSLADAEIALGNKASAARRYERALTIFTKVRGPDDGYVGRTLFFLGRLRGDMGQNKKAIPLLERALTIATKVVGPDHTATLETLARLAWELRIAGRYGESLKRYRALLARQMKLAPGSEEVAITGINLALVLKQMGKLEQATLEYRGSLKRLEALHGKRHPQIAIALDNLANVLAERGLYREAREVLDRAIPMWERLRGPDHPDTAVSMSALVSLLKEMGDLATAQPLAEKVVAIFTKAYGRKARRTAIAIDNLATILSNLGRYKRAEALYREALAIHEATAGRDHPSVATSANNIGWLLRMTGRDKQALGFYKRALAINTKARGPNSPAVAVNHGQLGATYLALGDVARARRHLDKARLINKRVLGDSHPNLAYITSSLADLEAAAGNTAAARKLSARSLAIAERHLEPLLYATSQRERLELVGQHRRKVHMYLSVFNRPRDARTAYDKVLRWKAIVLTSMIAQRQALLAHKDRRLRAKLDQLANVRTELANLAMAVPEKGERRKLTARMRTLSREKDRLERALSRRSEAFKAGQRSISADFRAVCRSLDRDAALVDYVRYVRTRGDSRAWHFAAFVTRGGACDKPVRVELGRAAAIDKAVRNYRLLMENNEDTDDILALAGKLRKLVWDKVQPALAKRRRIWVSTDGSLNGVPFGGLSHGRRFLVEDFTFAYVPNGAALLRRPAATPPPARRESLLIGGVRYGSRDKTNKRSRSRGSGCGIQSRPSYQYLPGTKRETDSVVGLFGKGAKVKTLTGNSADEETVKRLLPESRIVHMATHGFFARPCGENSSVENETASNPLVRSGIVLAGANGTRGALVVDGEDGVLTAEEVAELDLRAVDLAVLSACETGLGDIRDGEGVLGLRWAFHIAGAHALVMSLWQVPDEQTRQLMIAFYKHIQGKKKLDAASALRAAQLKMLRARRAEGDPSPWSWSAFIASGR